MKSFPIVQTTWDHHSLETYDFSIENPSALSAKAGIEIRSFRESLPALASYISVNIQERGENPKNLVTVKNLEDLVKAGYILISELRPQEKKQFLLTLSTVQELPDEFQEQQISFDFISGIEFVPSTQSAQLNALPSLNSTREKQHLEVAPTPSSKSGTVLGTQHTDLFAFPLLCILCACASILILLLLLNGRKKAREI